MKIKMAVTKDNNEIIESASVDIGDKIYILQKYMEIYYLTNLQDLLVHLLKYIREKAREAYLQEEHEKIDTDPYDDYTV